MQNQVKHQVATEQVFQLPTALTMGHRSGRPTKEKQFECTRTKAKAVQRLHQVRIVYIEALILPGGHHSLGKT